MEWATRVIGYTLQACANSIKDDWDTQLTFAEFAINNTASTVMLGREADMKPFFIDRCANPRLPLQALHADHAAHESPGQWQRMRSIEATVRELLVTAW